MKEIPLTRGLVSIVDDEDFEWLRQYKWRALVTQDDKKYAVFSRKEIEGVKTICMHRYILQAPSGMLVDHKDGDGLNNRRTNIRVCTTAQNCMNNGIVKGSSGFKGVRKFTGRISRPWQSYIGFQGKRHSLGYFATPEEAAVTYDQAALEKFGEFARTNKSLGLL